MPPSLLQTLEKTQLQASCAEQVEELHRLFVQWFRGTQPLPDLQRQLQERLADAFSHVAPNGQFLTGRQVLLGHLHDKYGCYHDRVFEIDIYNVKLVWTDGQKSLVTYEEWQSWQQDDETEAGSTQPESDADKTQQFGRLSTCLLEKQPNSSIHRWIHVHETWLEDEAPAADAEKASVTRSKMDKRNKTDDNDTIMTGPMPTPVRSGGKRGDAKLLPDDEDEEEDEVPIEQPKPDNMKTNSILANIAGAMAGGAAATAKTKGKDSEDDEEEEEEDAASEDDSSTEGPQPLAEKQKEDSRDQRTADTVDSMEDVDPKEKAFMEASKGILVFEDGEEATNTESPKKEEADNNDPPPKRKSSGLVEAAKTETSIPNDISKKRHVSSSLEEYAKPMLWEGALVGVSIAGFDIGTSQGPIGDEAWYKEHGAEMEDMSQSLTIAKPKRRICLPEMVHPVAHVALEGNGVWMSWDATDALECWAHCHKHIPVLSRVPYHGVNVLKSKDAKKWEEKRQHVSSNESETSVFHYDWTYSTPYVGTTEGGKWSELDESGMRMELLTDQSIPILFFDEVVLFEDDLHDVGQVHYSVKLRVMPTCAYILGRLYVRVDDVIVRLRETRLLVDFFGIKKQVYRDVTWRECMWDQMEEHGLPTETKKWVHSGRDTSSWNKLVRALPEVDPPDDIPKHAVLEY